MFKSPERRSLWGPSSTVRIETDLDGNGVPEVKDLPWDALA